MQSTIESPFNRMILQERKKATFHKLASILIVVAGLDMIASVYTFEPLMQGYLSSAHANVLGSWTALIFSSVVGLAGAVLSYSAYFLSKDRYASHKRLFILTAMASALSACFGIGAYMQNLSLIYTIQYATVLALGLLGILFTKKSLD